MARRVVVCAPGGEGNLLWELPISHFVEQRWVWGGVRSLHELAFAIAAAGCEVELRGWLHRPLYDALAEASGLAPALPGAARRPEPGEIVIVPEGHRDPLQFARVWLSGAQLVVMAMGPIGLTGWPFADGPAGLSPLTATPEQVNRSESFTAMAALGVALWSESPVIAAAARAAGAAAVAIGVGQPAPFPDPPASKPVDVALVRDNRWAPLALEAVEGVDCSVDQIGPADHDEMLRRLGAARILVYPTRIEGEPRITREARALGTVPVVLAGNPVATQLDDAAGALSVDGVAAMRAAIEALLADRSRLEELAARARATARAEAAWEPFVERVRTALEQLPAPDPALPARAAVGARLHELLAETTAARTRAEGWASELELEERRLRERKDALEQEVRALRSRRAVRLALGVANRIGGAGRSRGSDRDSQA